MKKVKSLLILFIVSLIVTCYNYYKDDIYNFLMANVFIEESFKIDELEDYSGKDYVYINNNVPDFKEEDKTREFEEYGKIDYLGRATYAYANVSKKTMPTKKRESIGNIKPSGWHTVKYDFIEGKFLYNRCHLIGYQLTAENANKNNLITCTRHMNSESMLEFENKVASYIKKTNNHVLYKVIPIYDNDNLVAKGVWIEALSVEDKGRGISFSVFIYNVQDGIKINYKNGTSFISK